MTKIERVEARHPGELLRCQDEPEVPPAPRSVGLGLAWVADMRAAEADCRARLACIRRRQAGVGCGS
ncbi:hypothetical protein [Stella humosa]|uniref:hypothetical protein n=1 Tax=Stella humosa TaxID=94 RepID=UPI000F4BE914|nr:hypothetical protein [Stella humosa]